MSDQQVKAIIDTLDMDSNGKIEWAEFASLMADRWLRHEGATDMHLALGLLRPEDGLDEDDDDAEIAVERIGKLLMGAGEKPLIAAEWAEMKQLMDPKGTGRVSVKAFRDLPCWAPPDLPGQELLRAHQKRREVASGRYGGHKPIECGRKTMSGGSGSALDARTTIRPSLPF